MIARYTRPEMGRIWSDENKFATWLEVELAASETLAELEIARGSGRDRTARDGWIVVVAEAEQISVRTDR